MTLLWLTRKQCLLYSHNNVRLCYAFKSYNNALLYIVLKQSEHPVKVLPSNDSHAYIAIDSSLRSSRIYISNSNYIQMYPS